MIVLVSQLLLIALAVAWGIYLITISKNGGEIISAETNNVILYSEIIATGLIIILAVAVISMELYRMSTRRREDSSINYRRRSTDNEASIEERKRN